jgi:GH15 family glucan-1,4-alpha-glucosidase
VLDTEVETDTGRVLITDCMPHWEGRSDVVRVIKGLEGRAAMRMEVIIRFDYGAVVPWVQSTDDGIVATAGPDSLELHTQVPLEGRDFRTRCEFDVAAGQTASFVLTHFRSERTAPLPIDPLSACAMTEGWWRAWSRRSTYKGEYADAVERELTQDGFVMRYARGSGVDGLGIEEGTFLPCSFWLVDNLAMAGREQEARRLFERLLAVRNDVGLLSEEYDPAHGRLMGNFPLAFTHVALINSARNLTHRSGGPCEHRSSDEGHDDGPS